MPTSRQMPLALKDGPREEVNITDRSIVESTLIQSPRRRLRCLWNELVAFFGECCEHMGSSLFGSVSQHRSLGHGRTYLGVDSQGGRHRVVERITLLMITWILSHTSTCMQSTNWFVQGGHEGCVITAACEDLRTKQCQLHSRALLQQLSSPSAL